MWSSVRKRTNTSNAGLAPHNWPTVQTAGGRSPQGGGKRIPAGTFKARPRFSFPITGYSCSPVAAMTFSGWWLPQALPSWDSFWLSFSSNRLRVRRWEEWVHLTRTLQFPPNSAPSVGSTTIQQFVLGTARVNNQSPQISCCSESSQFLGDL